MEQDFEQGKKTIEAIFNAAVDATDPYKAVKSAVKIEDGILKVDRENILYDLEQFDCISVIGCGKAVVPMAKGIEDILGNRIKKGIVTTKYNHTGKVRPEKITVEEAGHPVPDFAGMRSCRNIINTIRGCEMHDLVIALISGGGSSLWPQPVNEISLDDKIQLSEALLKSGANIHEVNTVRKHCSIIKGGWGAKFAFPSQVLVLAMSDVIGDNLDVIASGPFYPDASSFDDAWKIINKYNIRQGLPNSICSYIHKGMAGKVPETPKADDPAFKNIHHKIVSSNTIALNAAKTKAESLGFEVKIVDTPLMGEAKDAAVLFTSKLIEHANKKPFCLLAGGETTVTLNNNPGMGGRNQEFALAAARDIQDTGNTIVASCATDGNDGPTDATGGIVDSQTMSKANKQNLDINQALAAHNAYPLLNSLGQLFITGPTNTNVMDIQIGLILP